MARVIPACDRFVQWGLVTLITFTPLAFGTVEPWSIALMEWGIVTIALVFALSRLWPSETTASDTPSPRSPGLLGLAVPIGLFLFFAVVQLVPLPLSWLTAISPGSSRMYSSVDVRNWASAQPGASEANAGRQDPLLQLEERGRRPITVNPGRTRSRIVLLGSLVALFFVVARWADGRRAISILKSLTVIGFLVAVFGLVQLLTWNGKIYWVRRIPIIIEGTPTAFGPFVNHDHFAGYVEMVIPVALSLAFWLVDRRRNPTLPESPDPDDAGLSAALRAGRPEESGRWSQGSLAIFAAVMLIVSLFLSLSRGGILSAIISGTVLLILLCRRVASRLVRALIVVVLPLVVISIIALVGAETVKRQLGTYARLPGESSFQLRAILWRQMIREFPAYIRVGSGLGTFEDSFAPLTPAGATARWDRAHNDYLQLLWETGIPGATLFVVGLWIFIRRFWWPALTGRERPVDFFRVGLAVSLLSIALHSGVDFCLQIGANAFLCALIAGLIVALHRGTEPPPGGYSPVRAVAGPWTE